MVITQGMIRPTLSVVLALNSLVKPGMLIPYGPRVEPTGGPGVALPAGNCNFTTAVTFFAIIFPPFIVVRATTSVCDFDVSPTSCTGRAGEKLFYSRARARIT